MTSEVAPEQQSYPDPFEEERKSEEAQQDESKTGVTKRAPVEPSLK